MTLLQAHLDIDMMDPLLTKINIRKLKLKMNKENLEMMKVEVK